MTEKELAQESLQDTQRDKLGAGGGRDHSNAAFGNPVSGRVL